MISSSTLRLLALAIAGLLVAAAVAVAASQLASRQIGLASEPVFAGDDLAPRAARPTHEKDGGEHPAEPGATEPEEATTPSVGGESSTHPPETTPVEPTSPRDDSGGSDHGNGGDD